MFHPIFSHLRHAWAYLLVWLAIAGVHGFVLIRFYGLDFPTAVVDSAVSNGLFGGLGLSLWYVVRFVNVEKEGLFSILLTHLATATVVLLLWISLAKTLVTLFLNSATYPSFAEASLPGRFLVGLAFYLVIILLYYLVTYYVNFQEKTRQEASLNTLVRDAELATLRSQINPHFIFNSLNSISSLTMTFPEKAQEMTIKLSDFLRYSLAQDGKQLTSLAEEMHNVGLYMDIEKTRFGNRLRFEPQVEGNCLTGLLPNLILQPLFENAIKHGVYESLDQVTIRFRCSMERNFLKISVWNNFDPDAAARKGEGIGLRNIQDRLLLLYNRPDLLIIHRTEDTYEVNLLIPQFI
ncbi:MAG: histidine kinase [Ferruginibacter sp.]|nr:histidine kinase [Cytophagales bacterium]